MKLCLLTITVLFAITGCSSAQQSHEMETQPSQVYIDSVKAANQSGQKVLKLFGNYPDGCTHLEEVTHQIKNGEIHLQLFARRPADAMCTQALVPFSFIYDKLSEKEISDHAKVIIEGTTYKY